MDSISKFMCIFRIAKYLAALVEHILFLFLALTDQLRFHFQV